MGQLRRFKVEGLFNSANHEIDFSEDSPVTILSGPNGVGKTHILRLIHAAIGPDFQAMFRIPFHSAAVRFNDGKRLEVKKELAEKSKDWRINVTGFAGNGRLLGEFKVPDERTLGYVGYPPWLRRMRGGFLRDLEVGDTISLAEARKRYGPFRMPRQEALFDVPTEYPVWLGKILDGKTPILIDTKRLDTPKTSPDSNSPTSSHSRIDEYIEQVKLQVTEARRASLAVALTYDQSFAARVLSRSGKTIREDELKRRYEQIAEQNAELYRSGLSEAEVDVDFPSSGTDSIERRVLAVFIDDWQRKLEPLLPVNEKLKTLRRIINEKFIGKQLQLDKSGALVFVPKNEKVRIPVHLLSSGEQHILALFTMLLFSAEPGSVVLIDEPEISLHAAWKHDFLADIIEVAGVADLQVVLATHSSGIINGQWDLVRELEVNEWAPA